MRYFIILLLITGIVFLPACEQTNSTTEKTTEPSKDLYLQKGKTIASATFATLSTNLQKAMAEGGISEAVNYCNLAATPLVDSLAQLYQAKIKRTSLKVRNPANKPTALELEQLEQYQKSMEAGEKITPITRPIDEHTIAFYAPIHLMPLCQKCHGTVGETILEEDYELIKKHYQQDKAINYTSGDLRGMWSITMKK